MNSDVYRWCAVPLCSNTSIKAPNKLFINVPMKQKVRKTWLNLARRDPAAISPKSVIYFCEDHFDLQNDMENYIQYHVMGSVSKVRMKSACIPTRFECQPGRKRLASADTERYILKRQRKLLIEESEKRLAVASTSTNNSDAVDSSSETLAFRTLEEYEEVTTTYHKFNNKSEPGNILHQIRSKAVQNEKQLVNKSTSPIRQDQHPVSSSAFKIENCEIAKSMTSPPLKTSEKIFIKEEQPNSVELLQMEPAFEITEKTERQEPTQVLKGTLLKIMENPHSYIGLPKSCCYLLDLIEEQTQIPVNHIILCLAKIRLNSPFKQLADDFFINTTFATEIFFKNITVIASIMRQFIVSLDKDIIKHTLPIAFRHKFHHTSCIIDCFEIEIIEASKCTNQALSWSDYNKVHSIKYLVSCTPNGLVNYISPGYGGNITDTRLVGSCNFIKSLKPGMCVMVDKGFKHVEKYLCTEGIELVRPPNVVTGTNLSRSEVKETKQIASLRIHIERIFQHLREFKMLKPPHACLNTNLIKILDEVVIIACALINLKGSLIKLNE